MQMRLPVFPRILYPLLQDLLRLLDILPMQVDRVRRHAAVGVVLAEDKLGRLLVILLHLPAMRLAFLGELFGQSAVAVLVGLSRLAGSDQADVCIDSDKRTLSKHELRFAASWRARSRRRSYSASTSSREWSWLKAAQEAGRDCQPNLLDTNLRRERDH